MLPDTVTEDSKKGAKYEKNKTNSHDSHLTNRSSISSKRSEPACR